MRLDIIKPDDWHLHLRDGPIQSAVLPYSASIFKRAIIMPNLASPIISTKDAEFYREEIISNLNGEYSFNPLMTLYLTDSTNADDVLYGYKNKYIYGVKLYPANATTNSSYGVSDISSVYDILEVMEENSIPLLVHGEVVDNNIDIFDREKYFIDNVLDPLVSKFPNLKVILEHITTEEAVDFVLSKDSNVGATITPQHMMFDRNAMLVGGIRPHFYCLPILKRKKHQEALVKAATSGDKRFFLGTDSAPHEKDKKESSCGCAGTFNSLVAIQIYTTIFDNEKSLDKLEAFISINGAKFYGLPLNKETITLEKIPYKVPSFVNTTDNKVIIPFLAGETLPWSIIK